LSIKLESPLQISQGFKGTASPYSKYHSFPKAPTAFARRPSNPLTVIAVPGCTVVEIIVKHYSSIKISYPHRRQGVGPYGGLASQG